MTRDMRKTPRYFVRLAGFLYIIVIIVGFFAEAYVPLTLIIVDDMATTITNITTSESLFRLGIVGSLLMNIASILLALALYKLLEPAEKNMAVLMVVLLFFGAGIAMLNEVNHFAMIFLSSADTSSVFTAEQSQHFVQLFHDMREFGAYIAAIFWGLWLFPLGYLIIKSNFLPKFIGIMLIIAGIGYVVDSAILFLAPQLSVTITSFTFIGEVMLPVWLLFKGVDEEQWKTQWRNSGISKGNG